MHVEILFTVDELLGRTSSWDELWRESDVAVPTARAEHVAIWLRQFAAGVPFRCLTLYDGARLLAVWPLVQTRAKGLLPVGAAAGNCWSAAGQLMIGRSATNGGLDLLAASIERLPWPLLQIEGVDPTTESWRRLLSALQRSGNPVEFRPNCQVGLIDVDSQRGIPREKRSKNLVRNLGRLRRRLESLGAVTFEHACIDEETQAADLWSQALAIEQRSWKASKGSLISESNDTHAFFQDQARLLASWGALEFSFLKVNDRPIAFQYGYRGKGIYFAHKSGFDETFAACGPGQLLMCELLNSLHEDSEVHAVDCLGPINEAIRRWASRTYTEGRLLIAPRNLSGRMLWQALRIAQQWLPARTSSEIPIGPSPTEPLAIV